MTKDELSDSQLTEISEKFTFNIVGEWDFEKNSKEFPNASILKIGVTSAIKIWWKCNLGHSYDSFVRNRTIGYNCAILLDMLQVKLLLVGLLNYCHIAKITITLKNL